MPTDMQLLAMAERMLLEVAHRATPQDADLPLPALLDTADDPGPTTLQEALLRHGHDDVTLLAELGVPAEPPAAVLGPDGRAELARCAAAVTTALHATPAENPSPRLIAAALRRCFLAHQLAFALGSTACPLPEDLASALLERTTADAEQWRRAGYYRTPLAIPPQASWRDQFLRTTGRDPHPEPQDHALSSHTAA